MTEEEVRPLDRRIASLVGDEYHESGDWSHYWTSTDGSRYADEDQGPRHFSRDIEDAWRVVTCLMGRGYGFRLQSRGERWRAVFHERNTPTLKTYGATADTAPLAICQAALEVPFG